jgi:hypothetical protein
MIGTSLKSPHRFFDLLVEPDAKILQLGNVGLIVIGHVRDHHPIAMKVRAGDLLDTRKRLALDRAEFGKIDLRPRQQIEPRCSGGSRRARWSGRRRNYVRGQDASARPAALERTQIDAALARELD